MTWAPKRLGRKEAECRGTAAGHATPHIIWLGCLRKQVSVEESSGSSTLWQLTDRGRENVAGPAAARPPNRGDRPVPQTAVPGEQ